MVGIDWLHTVDLGCLQDLLGNVIWELMPECDGATQAARIHSLWLRIDRCYTEHKPPARLDNLTLEMVRADSSQTPKLKCKGGEARYLLPIFFGLTSHWRAAAATVHQQTAGNAVRFLYELQQLVSAVPYETDVAAECCRKFCLAYAALEQEQLAMGVFNKWKMKPKFHMLQELVEYAAYDMGSPKDFWCYQDESWVGFLGKIAHRRGGLTGPSVATRKLLTAYRAGLV